MAIQDLTGTNLVSLRRTIYLTIMSSLDFEECAHKLLKMTLQPGMEVWKEGTLDKTAYFCAKGKKRFRVWGRIKRAGYRERRHELNWPREIVYACVNVCMYVWTLCVLRRGPVLFIQGRLFNILYGIHIYIPDPACCPLNSLYYPCVSLHCKSELCHMIIDCCSQERSYLKFYGLLAERFCNVNQIYRDEFGRTFNEQVWEVQVMWCGDTLANGNWYKHVVGSCFFHPRIYVLTYAHIHSCAHIFYKYIL